MSEPTKPNERNEHSERNPKINERVARLEAQVGDLQESSRTIQSTLHSLIKSALASHEAAISRLMTAHDAKLGAWWTIIWVGAVLITLASGAAWLLERNIDIIIKK